MQDPSIFVGEGLPVAFSSISFLFYFLPLFFIIYYLIPARAKNVVLLAASLFFYAWGEPRWILLLLASILVTWLLGRAMRPEASAGRRRGLLILGLVFQLGLLVAVKYAGFFFGAFIDLPKLHLPLGVSFYTFHAISYLVDVYRQKTPPQKNLLRLGLYLALFPKLVMGPIVPYHELEPALAQRTIDAQDVSDGCYRFTIGLAKKALLADALAGLVTGIWGDLASLTVLSAWLGLIGYALQLYFDFSGYSDMAIGLGRMLGFRFPENFRYPYLCSSISDFWRRWHISLGSWFKEYLYFPPRRQPRGDAADAAQSAPRLAGDGIVARGELELRAVGPVFRRAHLPGKAARAAFPGTSAQGAAGRALPARVPAAGGARLGLVPGRGSASGRAVFCLPVRRRSRSERAGAAVSA